MRDVVIDRQSLYRHSNVNHLFLNAIYHLDNTSMPYCSLTGYSWMFYHLDNTSTRRSLKSGPETQDLEPWDPRTVRPRALRSGILVHGTLTPRTVELGPWHTGLGNCDPETQNPESRILRIALVTQVPTRTNWINFSCEANFDNKKLGHLSQKRRCSSWWTKTFWHLT